MQMQITSLVSGLILLALLGFGGLKSTAQSPTAVGLRYFRGVPLDNSVRLEWETGTEQNTAAFKIMRAPSAAGPFEFLENIGLVPAVGNTQAGATYERVDDTAENGSTYWYQLVEVETNNNEVILATIEVFVDPPSGGIDPPGGGNEPPPASTSLPTSTTEPTATPSPTDTPASSDTPEPTPENTLEPTETPELATTTFTPRPLGPTPTAFRFGTATPAGPGAGAAGVGVPVAEAAGLPGQQGYPAVTGSPVVIQATSYPAGTPFPQGAATTGPGDGATNNSLGGPATATGIAGSIGAAGQEDSANATSSRLLLWLGFAGGLLILTGGIFFSIFLATRRK